MCVQLRLRSIEQKGKYSRDADGVGGGGGWRAQQYVIVVGMEEEEEDAGVRETCLQPLYRSNLLRQHLLWPGL